LTIALDVICVMLKSAMCLLMKVSREKALASEEEKKVQVINADVAKKQKACQEDLAKAEPALIAAKNALGTLNKVLLISHYYKSHWRRRTGYVLLCHSGRPSWVLLHCRRALTERGGRVIEKIIYKAFLCYKWHDCSLTLQISHSLDVLSTSAYSCNLIWFLLLKTAEICHNLQMYYF